MLLDLIIYPHPVLKAVAKPIEVFDESLSELIANIVETMHEGAGVGLAAPQVGLSLQLFVVDTSTPEEPSALRTYINPRIILQDKPILWEEGCLSLPGLYREVPTHQHVIIEARDARGEWFREEAHDLRAVAILHEFAHLQGSLFIDRLNPVKRNLTKKYWAKNAAKLTEHTYRDTKLHCKMN
ncbi:MAG: peptide deformylase [Proteobacteria bacterium]|nr:peptide deformylase [Pseudomonadota bacterium]